MREKKQKQEKNQQRRPLWKAGAFWLAKRSFEHNFIFFIMPELYHCFPQAAISADGKKVKT
jgi:hypothetical protein